MENMASNIYLENEEGLGEIQRRDELRGLENTDGKLVDNKKLERHFYLNRRLSAGPNGCAV